jgi:hypothetical protein
MDTGAIFERIEQSCKALKIDLSFGEIASFADDNTLSPEQLDAIASLFGHLEDKKHQTVIDFLLRTSRLPLKVPKTFDGYDFDRIHGKDSASVRNLPSLTEDPAVKTG